MYVTEIIRIHTVEINKLFLSQILIQQRLYLHLLGTRKIPKLLVKI